MPLGGGSGSDFEVYLAIPKKRGTVNAELVPLNLRTDPATAKRPERTHSWVASKPGMNYRIMIVDKQSKKRDKATRKEVFAEVRLNGDVIQTAVFIKHKDHDETFTKVDSVLSKSGDKATSYPLTFPPATQVSAVKLEEGVAAGSGIGTVSIVLSYGTDAWLPAPVLGPAVDLPSSTSTPPSRSKRKTKAVRGKAVEKKHEQTAEFTFYDNEPFHKFFIKFCPPNIIEQQIANANKPPPVVDLVESPPAISPVAQRPASHSPPRATSPWPSPTPQSSAPTPINDAGPSRKRPVPSSPIHPPRPSKKPVSSATAARAVEELKQRKDRVESARMKVEVAEDLVKEERAVDGDDLSDLEQILEVKTEAANRAEQALRGAIQKHTDSGAINAAVAEELLEYLNDSKVDDEMLVNGRVTHMTNGSGHDGEVEVKSEGGPSSRSTAAAKR